MPRTPWIALAAVISMFVIPFLPTWLFEGPRTIKHHPRRHVCADCNEPWTAGHMCLPAAEVPEPLRGELRRPHSPADRGSAPLRALPARWDGARRDELGSRRGSRKTLQ